MPEKAFVHALYGCACANPANLGFVLLTHLVLRHHNTSAKLLVYHGPERACAPDRLRRVLVEPDVHFRPLAPYEAFSTSKAVHGPGQIGSKPPSADWINKWLPLTGGILIVHYPNSKAWQRGIDSRMSV